MNGCSQLQLNNLTIARALPVTPMVLAPPATPISLSGPATQFISTLPQFHSVSPIVSSRIPVNVPVQHSTHHSTIASQFINRHSQVHHPHTSALANSNKTRGNRHSNGSLNAMSMAKRFLNSDSKFSGADNEKIMDFIV